MGIKAVNTNVIDAYIDRMVSEIDVKIVRKLLEVGERCVNRARITEEKGKDYTDKSGNLRGSVGYILVANGVIINEGGFEPVKGATEGPEAGRNLAHRLVKDYPQFYVLIVVAGMQYASFVSDKGYDVLDSAELLAEKLLNDFKNKL